MLSPRQSSAASLHLSHTSTPGAISISEPQQHNGLAQHTAALTMPSHSARGSLILAERSDGVTRFPRAKNRHD